MNNPFDRTTIARLERPLSSDHNREFSQENRSLLEVLRASLSARSQTLAASVPYSGFIGDGFRIVPTSPGGMSVQVTPGLGFVYAPLDLPTDIGAPTIEGVHDVCSYKPVWLAAPAQFSVPAPNVGMIRIDIIEVKIDRRLTDSTTRRLLNVDTKAFEDIVVSKTLTFGLDGRTGTVSSPSDSTAGLSLKVGAEHATSPVAPTVTAGYVKLGEVRTIAGVSPIVATDISDVRPLLFPGGVCTASIRFRLQWGGGVPAVTVHSVTAPPGIQIGARGLTTGKSYAQVYAVGGNILRATAKCTLEHTTTAFQFTSNTAFMPRWYSGTPSYPGMLTPIQTGESGDLAACTPLIATGFAVPRATVAMNTMFVANDGLMSQTDSSLEDLTYNVSFELAYL